MKKWTKETAGTSNVKKPRRRSKTGSADPYVQKLLSDVRAATAAVAHPADQLAAMTDDEMEVRAVALGTARHAEYAAKYSFGTPDSDPTNWIDNARKDIAHAVYVLARAESAYRAEEARP